MPTIPIQPQSPPIVNQGNNAFNAYLQCGFTYGRNDSGYFQNFHYEGNNADITSTAQIFANLGWTFTVTPCIGGGFSRLEAHAGWAPATPGTPGTPGTPQNYNGETPEDIWEMDAQESQVKLLEADFPQNPSLALSSSLSRTSLAKMIDAGNYNFLIGSGGATAGAAFPDGGTENGVTYYYNGEANPTDTDGSPMDSVNLPARDYSPSRSLYLLSIAGTSEFPMEASVIRHTQMVSNQYTAQASYNNVGRIITPASMYSVEGVPYTLLFDVPTLPSAQQFIENPGDLVYAFRKVRPAITRLALFKWRIVQNYQFGLWPTNLFGSAL